MKVTALVGALLLASFGSGVAYLRLSDGLPGKPAEDRAKGESSVKRELSCGPKCLFTAARRLGLPLEWGRVAEYFRDGSSQGTTLRALEEGATAFGLLASTRRLTWKELVEHDGVAILFVKQHHFIAIDPREKPPREMGMGDSVRVYDPDRVARWVSRVKVESIWEGECLLLTKPQQTLRDGPAVSVNSCYQDEGLVKGQMSVGFRFPVQNFGTAPLSLNLINATCACTSAHVSSTLVAPGAQAYVETHINLENKRGRFSEAVRVATNDPKCRAITFNLCGAAPRELLLSTRRAYLGRLSPGSAVDYAVAVYDPGEERLDVSKVDVRLSKRIPACESQPMCEATLRSFDATNEQVRKRMKLSPRDTVVQLRVSAPVDTVPGPFEFECTVATNLAEWPVLPLIVEGSVLPDLVADPPALVVVETPAAKAIARTSIRSRSARAIRQLKATLQSTLVATVEVKESAPDMTVLTLSLPNVKERAEGSREGCIHCALADRRMVDIPFVIVRSPQSPPAQSPMTMK